MADCTSAFGIPIDPTCLLTPGGLPSIPGKIAGGIIDQLADEVTKAVGNAVASVGTLWVKVGTPNLTSSDGVSPSDTVGFLQGSLFWYMTALAVLSVIIAGAKMAYEGRAQPGKELAKGLVTLVVVSGAGLAILALAVTASDEFAKWIIDSSLKGTDFGTNITALLGLGAVTGLGAIIVIVLGLIALLASFVQIMLMVLRGGLLVIMAGVLPISAAGTSTEPGKVWFKKVVGFMVAVVLYKPAAAIVYATAFRLAGSDVFHGDGLVSALAGLVLMILALVALPALMRFVMPMVAAVGTGSGGGSAAAAGAMAAAPTGALNIPRGGGGSSNGAAPASAGKGGAPPSGAASVVGSRGPAGGDGSNGAKGNGNGGAPAPPAPGGGKQGGAPASPGAAPVPAGGVAASGGGGAAAGAGAASAGGAAAGPAGAAAAVGMQAAKRAKDAAQGATESQTGEGGPSGS